jgi:hypothetical protein
MLDYLDCCQDRSHHLPYLEIQLIGLVAFCLEERVSVLQLWLSKNRTLMREI